MYRKFGRPNVESGRKMTNGRLLFLALLHYAVVSTVAASDIYTVNNSECHCTVTNSLQCNVMPNV